jgi:hypothetical protein
MRRPWPALRSRPSTQRIDTCTAVSTRPRLRSVTATLRPPENTAKEKSFAPWPVCRARSWPTARSAPCGTAAHSQTQTGRSSSLQKTSRVSRVCGKGGFWALSSTTRQWPVFVRRCFLVFEFHASPTRCSRDRRARISLGVGNAADVHQGECRKGREKKVPSWSLTRLYRR